MGDIIPFQDLTSMAAAIAKSGLFGIKKPEEAMGLMLVAQAEGRHPGIVARDYHIISGRATLKADAMLARFQEAGGKIQYGKFTDEEVEATFTHPAGGTLTMSWTIAMAKRAGVIGNPTWSKYPRAMLRARLISEGIRTIYPGVICGSYTPEEVQDFEPQPVEKEVDATVHEPEPPPAPPELASAERITALRNWWAGQNKGALPEDIDGEIKGPVTSARLKEITRKLLAFNPGEAQ